MKIALLTSAHPRYDVRIFLKEANSLLEAGFAVTLVVADGKGDETKNGVHILDAGFKSNSRLHRMTSTVKLVYNKAIATKAVFFLLHDQELFPLLSYCHKRNEDIS